MHIKQAYSNTKKTMLITVLLLIMIKTLHFEIEGLISIFGFIIFILPFILINVIVLLFCFVRLLMKRQWKTVLIYLCLLCTLLLPLTEWYEQTRFDILRPQMEAVAVQIAKDMQNKHIKKQETLFIDLPKSSAYLSRGGRIVCMLYSSTTEIVFYKAQGLLEYSELYYFNTHIPFWGSAPENLELFWLEDVQESKSIYRDWHYIKTG